MTKRFKTGLAATAAALAFVASPAAADHHGEAATAAAATTVEAVNVDPAIWVVEDEDTTIYLFGTFHAMKAGVDWFNDEVKTSYDAADQVVVELVPPENPAEMQPLIMKYAIDMTGTPLSAELSEEGRAALHATLAQMGAPAQAFDMFKPGFANIALTAGLMPGMGFEEGLGVDKTIIAAANADGKPIHQLETMEEQLAVLTTSISEEEQLEMLEQTLADLDEMDDMLEGMLAAWKTGDEAHFVELFGELNDQSEAFYTAMLTDRNAKWAEWIDARMDEPGQVFIAVGAGHLAGEKSVQEFLAARDITVTRIQ